MQEQPSPLGLAVAGRVVFPTPVIAVSANVQKEARELRWQHHESMPNLKKASERQKQALEFDKQLQEILSRES